MDVIEKTRSVAETALGAIEGASVNDVVLFRGVPYAAPSTGPRRFALPGPVEPWRGVRPATAPAPIGPQLPSRLRVVMGDFERPTSEDCLTLTIATPAVSK